MGVTEIPFIFTLEGKSGKTLYETYHGVFVNIQYFIKVNMKRGLLAKDIEKSCEIIVEYPVRTKYKVPLISLSILCFLGKELREGCKKAS